MKFVLFYIAFLLLSLNTFAQDKDDDIISRYRPGMLWFYTGIKPAQVERVRKYDRLIVDLVYNDWIGKEQKPFKVSPLSVGFNANLMFDISLSKNNTTTFGLGLAYGLYRVQMNDFFTRNEVQQATFLVKDISQYGIEKSVFKINTISIPLELRFRGKNWRHAKIHLGGRLAYSFLPSTTLSTTDDNITSKQKTVGFYDFNHFNASAHIRLGLRNWGIYASYNIIPLFKNEASIQLNPIQFGLSLALF